MSLFYFIAKWHALVHVALNGNELLSHPQALAMCVNQSAVFMGGAMLAAPFVMSEEERILNSLFKYSLLHFDKHSVFWQTL